MRKTRLEASRLLAEQGIVAGPCFDAADLASDPHVAAHEMVIAVPRPDGAGEVHIAGNPIKLSASETRTPERWPSLGAHTRDLIRRKAIGFEIGETPVGVAEARPGCCRCMVGIGGLPLLSDSFEAVAQRHE